MANPLKKDNTKAFITIGFLAVFFLMGLAMALSMATLNSTNDEMSELIEYNASKTRLTYQMRDDVRLRSSSVRSLQQISDPTGREKVFSNLIQNTSSYIENRESFNTLGTNASEQDILRKIAEADQRINEAYEKANRNIYSPTGDSDALKTSLGEVQLQEFVLLNHLNDLVELEKELAEETVATNFKRYEKTQYLLLLLLSAAFTVSLIIANYIIKKVTKANQKIAHLANHDDLTGLNNRRSFEEHLQHVVNVAPRSKDLHGLMFIDLDRFKIVNDTCGHHAGDQLLIQLTSMIKGRLRKGDMFARIGGDEFAIIARGKTFHDVVNLAEELRVLVQDFDYVYEDQVFKVSLSVGVIPLDGETTNLEDIVSDVDSACYVAKQSGRNRVHVTQENDAEVVKYRNDIAGMRNIRAALAQDRLVLFYQPVYRILPDGVKMEHCEILLRIKSESGELFSPAEFIPIAEKYNVMTEIDRWVFSHVVEWLIAHQDSIETPKLLMNLSGLSFINDEFLEFVVDKLKNSGVDPQKLAFEITETAAVDNMEKANGFIERVQQLGSNFALDDFGSGFSTFAYLKKLPIDYLKIDGSLVKNMASNTIDREMVRAINQIGRTVGAHTIAEFVEDDETLVQLREMGVDYAQGFGLCKPKSLMDLRADLEMNQKDIYKKAS